MFYFLIIVVALEILSFLFFPVVSKLFSGLNDSGYSLSKSLTVVIFAFLSWYLIGLRLIPFVQISLILVILISFIILLLLKQISFQSFDRKKLVYYLAADIIFICIFAFTSYLKYRTSPIAGTEKPMDFAFINGILKSTYFPPQDPWYAGGAINYYYFGHYFIAYIAKLLTIPGSIIYTFALPLVFALTAVNIYSVIINYQTGNKLRIPLLIACLSLILVLFSGNLDLLQKTISNLFFRGHQIINWWDPSRIIGRGFLKDSYITITEFPYFSLLLGDVHAHVISLLFGSLFISLCFCLYQILSKGIRLTLSTAFNLILPAALLAIIAMSNPWDLPGYIILLFLIVMVSFIKNRPHTRLFLLPLIIITISFLISIAPFITHFDMIRPVNDPKSFLVFIHDVSLIGRHTLFGEYLNVWGSHLVLSLLAFVVLFFHKRINSKKMLFPLVLIIVGVFLVVFCEFFYINDFFLPPNERMNTVFKLYYQAWLILGLGVPLLLSHALAVLKPYLQKICLVVSCVILVGSLNYSIFATPLRLTEFSPASANFDGLAYMNLLPDTLTDLKAINWLTTHVPDQVGLLESAVDPQGGSSYSRLGRISAATGLPTAIGWSALNHEGGWRNNSPDIRLRIDNVAALYNSRDLNQTRQLLKKYRLEYIYYGPLEKEAYPNADISKYGLLGRLVYSDGAFIYRIDL